MPSKRRPLRTLALLVLLFALATGAPAERLKVKDLPERYQEWLDEVALLISKKERQAFLEIQKDYQRDAFIKQFWAVRDHYPSTARNEFKERWEARVDEARAAFGDLTDERSELVLLNGPPDAQIQYRCSDLWPGEVWYYRRPETLGSEIVLILYQKGGLGRYRVWIPDEGIEALMRFPSGDPNAYRALTATCTMQDGDAIWAAVRNAANIGVLGMVSAVAEMRTPRDNAPKEWIETFNSYSTDIPEGAAAFPAELELSYPGRHKARTVLQGLVRVASVEVGTAELGGYESFNFQLYGEVLREGELFDTFRYSYNLPTAEVTEEQIPLVFERYLRPGVYDLVVKIEDQNGDRYFREERSVDVPRVETVRTRVPQDSETARLLAEANASILSGETSIQIVPPRGDLQTGMLRIDTLVTGDVDHVVFALDGAPVLTKRSPPFNVELDLGSLPRMRTLSVTAFDAEGYELARDEEEVNGGSHRFTVRLLEPRRGVTYGSSLRAEAAVEVPEGKVVQKVEFYLNETLVASLYQPPFVQPILLGEAGQVAYVRAVAYQPDGNSTEDLVFVNAPDFLEEVDVQFVELYIAVLNRDKRPVEGLQMADFEVLEDGVPQEALRFDLVTNLPIHAGIMLDTSASMDENMEIARNAALGFFQEAITPRDRATLITFNDHPNLAAKFTSDLDSLAGGLAGLKAERGTALYDSLIFALYYFNGIKGQRALVLLSDGRDEISRFTFEDTLEYARRAGVAIYSIGLDLGNKLADARRKLTKLAQETGGRSFFVDSAAELPAIYAAIQRELRSRYYLAYQSNQTTSDNDFRSIEVEVARSGLEAKTLRGYYP